MVEEKPQEKPQKKPQPGKITRPGLNLDLPGDRQRCYPLITTVVSTIWIDTISPPQYRTQICQLHSHTIPPDSFSRLPVLSVKDKLPNSTPDHICCQFEIAYPLVLYNLVTPSGLTSINSSSTHAPTALPIFLSVLSKGLFIKSTSFQSLGKFLFVVNKHLNRFGIANSPKCSFCNLNEDMERNHLLHCPAFIEETNLPAINTGVQESEWFHCQVLDIRYQPTNRNWYSKIYHTTLYHLLS